MSILKGLGALVLWLDVAPELNEETDHWYMDEHMPDRVDVGGYLRARRYQAVQGAPAYLSLFEAHTPEALASDGYLSLVKKISHQSQHIRAGFSNVVRNTFRIRVSLGRGVSSLIASFRLTPVNAKSIDMDGIDALAPNILRHPGVVGVHWLQSAPDIRAQMDKVRVTGQTDGVADYVLFIEAARLSDIHAVQNTLLSEHGLHQMGWAVENFGVYGFLYEVSSRVTDINPKSGD